MAVDLPGFSSVQFPCEMSCRAAVEWQLCTPKTLTRNMRSKSSGVRSRRAFTWAIPALATMVFKGPNSLTLVWTTFSTSLKTETSPSATVDFRPSCVISCAVSSAPCLLAEMSLMHTS